MTLHLPLPGNSYPKLQLKIVHFGITNLGLFYHESHIFKNSVKKCHVRGKKNSFPNVQWENIFKNNGPPRELSSDFSNEPSNSWLAPRKKKNLPPRRTQKSTDGSKELTVQKIMGKLDNFNRKIQTRIQKSAVRVISVINCVFFTTKQKTNATRGSCFPTWRECSKVLRYDKTMPRFGACLLKLH